MQFSLPPFPGPRSPVTACAAHEPEEALDVRVETLIPEIIWFQENRLPR